MPQKTLALHLSKCPDRPANYKTCTHNCLHILPASDLEVNFKSIEILVEIFL